MTKFLNLRLVLPRRSCDFNLILSSVETYGIKNYLLLSLLYTIYKHLVCHFNILYCRLHIADSILIKNLIIIKKLIIVEIVIFTVSCLLLSFLGT